MRSAVANMQQSTASYEVISEDTIVVAKGPGYEVKLIRVRRGTPPSYRPESGADILCLSLDEFSLPEAVAWVRAAVSEAEGIPPCIAVLGSIDKLAREDLKKISQELEMAGAIFHAWPQHCCSFQQAFEFWAGEISQTYEGTRIGSEEQAVKT